MFRDLFDFSPFLSSWELHLVSFSQLEIQFTRYTKKLQNFQLFIWEEIVNLNFIPPAVLTNFAVFDNWLFTFVNLVPLFGI